MKTFLFGSFSVSLNAIKKINVVVSLCCPSTTTNLFAKPAFSSLITTVPKSVLVCRVASSLNAIQ